MTEPFRIRHARPIVITTTLAILAVAGTVGLVRYQRANKAFNTYQIHADQTQLRGLKKLMDVKILGEVVGMVTDISYRDTENRPSDVTISLKITEPDKHVVLANSRVIVGRALGVGGAPHLEIERSTDLFGLIVSNLSTEESSQLKTSGVRIVKVMPDSPASNKQLENAIIVGIGENEVRNVRDYYVRMSEIAAGQFVDLIVFQKNEPVSLIATAVKHTALKNNDVIHQFEPEESSVNKLADRLTNVQKSIGNVEESFVGGMDNTNKQMNDSIGPSFDSLKDSSDKFRTVTLPKASDTLAKVDVAADTATKRINTVSDRIEALCDKSAKPAFESFGDASKSLKLTSENLKATVDTVGQETSATITELKSAILTLQELLDDMRPVVDVLQRESQDLPGTARRINTTVQKAQTTIDGINNHWLLKGSIRRNERKKANPTSQATGLRGIFHKNR